MTEHTPGPWQWLDDGYGEECDPPEPGKRWLTITDGDDYEIAVLVRRGGDPTEQQQANARLIAAAPELLEALSAALPFIGYQAHVPELIVAAERAIEKATGNV